MMTELSCEPTAVQAEPRGRTRCLRAGLLAPILACLVAMLSGCATPKPDTTVPTAALSLKEAVAKLATAMVTNAQLPPANAAGKYPIVIDPWIDRTTGVPIATTRLMQQEILALAPQHFPMLELLPFTEASLARRPLVLLGAITAVDRPGSTTPVTGRPGAYRIYGVLADLSTGKIAANESAWVQPDDVDVTPSLFFQRSPAWWPEESTKAYLRTAETPPGGPIDPAYRDGLVAEALIVDATTAYEAGQYGQALALYESAATRPEGQRQLRVDTGLYLTHEELGQTREAEEAFARIVQDGIKQDRLALKFLFKSGSTAFWPDPEVSKPYPMWLQVIAGQVAQSPVCLDIVGHASPTGTPELNDRLSDARARMIEERLIGQRSVLRSRLVAEGVGARDPLVGSGKDDASDLLDRRVDFKARSCTAAGHAQSAKGSTAG
jgi:outer membrane protein OmpA-like peptidoglycan-associated protein